MWRSPCNLCFLSLSLGVVDFLILLQLLGKHVPLYEKSFSQAAANICLCRLRCVEQCLYSHEIPNSWVCARGHFRVSYWNAVCVRVWVQVGRCAKQATVCLFLIKKPVISSYQHGSSTIRLVPLHNKVQFWALKRKKKKKTYLYLHAELNPQNAAAWI